MTIGRLCEHIICLLHTPIRVYSEEGMKISVYGDNGEQQDVIDCDPEFGQMLLGLRNPDCPVVHLEPHYIVYAVVAAGEQTYLLGPCCLGQDDHIAAKYLIKEHRLDHRKPL